MIGNRTRNHTLKHASPVITLFAVKLSLLETENIIPRDEGLNITDNLAPPPLGRSVGGVRGEAPGIPGGKTAGRGNTLPMSRAATVGLGLQAPPNRGGTVERRLRRP